MAWGYRRQRAGKESAWESHILFHSFLMSVFPVDSPPVAWNVPVTPLNTATTETESPEVLFCCSDDPLLIVSAKVLVARGLEQGLSCWLQTCSTMATLSVFRDVPQAQKLEGSLLKIYRQDDCSSKMFLAYRGRSQSFLGLRFSTYFGCL